jgi:hypothetical protein
VLAIVGAGSLTTLLVLALDSSEQERVDRNHPTAIASLSQLAQPLQRDTEGVGGSSSTDQHPDRCSPTAAASGERRSCIQPSETFSRRGSQSEVPSDRSNSKNDRSREACAREGEPKQAKGDCPARSGGASREKWQHDREIEERRSDDGSEEPREQESGQQHEQQQQLDFPPNKPPCLIPGIPCVPSSGLEGGAAPIAPDAETPLPDTPRPDTPAESCEDGAPVDGMASPYSTC